MKYKRLETDVKSDEGGFHSKVYPDSVGVWTIGYGTTRIFGVSVNADTSDMLKPIAEEILRSDLFGACIDAQTVIPSFNELGSVRQEVLVNMAYNLGRTGLAGFKKMLKAVDLGDYETAADEMLDSKWAKQVKTRAVRLAQQMRPSAV